MPETAILPSENEVAYSIHINYGTCTGCGLCEAFCPVDVYEMKNGLPVAVRPQDCWGCETCSGQCPTGSIRIEALKNPQFSMEAHPKAPELPEDRVRTYKSWQKTLREVLGLRWYPVSVSLIKAGQPWPDVAIPDERLRFCQSLMAARRGRSLLMPANRHACPDGTSILGLTEVPKKLASGELYILFHKLDSIEAAKKMVAERPSLEPRSVTATVVSPLADAKTDPDVIAVIANPEQMMWLSMATSYYSGHRHDLHTSGYNAQCVETSLIPYLNGEINISFGCYGCRASTDIDDSLMMMGIPAKLMPDVIRGLKELGKKSIPESRNKIYLPPL
ncbi:MAG: DUF169 domain-containing protein [Eggerthellaceae bacterium]|nr:DUF169 domain-containing protein [Eggerthellaceae bacterium]